MPTKDELENQIYEKMSQENAAFLAEMKTKSPDEIISRAYEIACRDNLLMLFEDETSLSERQLAVLTEFEHPLSQLYTDWLSRDTDEMDAFRDSIACCADDKPFVAQVFLIKANAKFIQGVAGPHHQCIFRHIAAGDKRKIGARYAIQVAHQLFCGKLFALTGARGVVNGK